MKSDPSILDLLNEVLTGELTAVNQYFLHAKMCENWGYERLYQMIRHESIDEMKHADKLVDRILYLEGLPNLQRYWKLTIGQTVPEQLKLDYDTEVKAIALLNGGIKLARDKGDNGTAELLEDILGDEERHANWLEAQLHLVGELGPAHYLAQQVKKGD